LLSVLFLSLSLSFSLFLSLSLSLWRVSEENVREFLSCGSVHVCVCVCVRVWLYVCWAYLCVTMSSKRTRESFSVLLVSSDGTCDNPQ
jgi:hypothetical protein